jgi:hypothetical protein
LIDEINLEPCGGQTMTVTKLKTKKPSVEALVSGERDLMKALMKEALQEVLAAEMTEFLGAGPDSPHPRRTPLLFAKSRLAVQLW